MRMEAHLSENGQKFVWWKMPFDTQHLICTHSALKFFGVESTPEKKSTSMQCKCLQIHQHSAHPNAVRDGIGIYGIRCYHFNMKHDFVCFRLCWGIKHFKGSDEVRNSRRGGVKILQKAIDACRTHQSLTLSTFTQIVWILPWKSNIYTKCP